MSFRAKLLALSVLIFAGLAITFSNPALAGQEAFEKSGGPVDTWNRPVVKAFEVGKDINPVSFAIGVALTIILLQVARGTFAKFVPLGFVRAMTSIGIILIVWEMVIYLHFVNSVLLPPPTTVIVNLHGHWEKGYLQIHIMASLQRLFIAFFLAIATGIPLGFLIANFRKFSDYVDPLFNLMRVVPPPAWLPFAILWFGIGNPPSIFIIWLGAFFPILMNTILGIKDTQQIHIESMQNLGGSRIDVYTKVMLPSAFPTMFTGIRIGFGIGWICLVTAELVAVDAGLGWMIEDARNLLDTPTVVGGMVVIMLFGIFFDIIFRAAEKEVVKWQ